MKLLCTLAIFILTQVCCALPGYIAIHETLVAKNFLGDAKCFEFANNYIACLHSSNPERIPGTLASGNDGYFTSASCETNGPWNLIRIQHDKSTTERAYAYNPAVKAVNVYVVDSFIDLTHPEFQARATLGFKNVEGSKNQHGTHVATTIAGAHYGVAKNAHIISVQVLDDDGRGKWSGLLEGLSYVSKNEALKEETVVVNMSIGGDSSAVINKAVELLVKQGIIVVVAAGNSAKNACETSPAGASGVVTVGSANRNDVFSSFSNYGSCVDIIAPGEDITAGVPGGGYGTMSGTSMASPHVSGMLANYLGTLKNLKTTPYCASTYLY